MDRCIHEGDAVRTQEHYSADTVILHAWDVRGEDSPRCQTSARVCVAGVIELMWKLMQINELWPSDARSVIAMGLKMGHFDDFGPDFEHRFGMIVDARLM